MNKTRKAPSDSATKYPVGTKMKGNDGNLWIIVKTKNNIKRWKLIKDASSKKSSKSKTLKVSGKVYYTHHNGSRPYKVVVNKDKVTIFRLGDDVDVFADRNPNDYTVLVKEYSNVKKVFIGKSIKGDDAHYSFATSSEAKKFGLGNSILLYLSKSKSKFDYSFIGDCVYEFKTDDEIVEYYSMIDRNDAPLPVAITKNDVYFMISYGYYGYVSRDYFEGFPKPYGWGLHSYSRLWIINEFSEYENIPNNKIHKFKNLKKLHAA